MAHAVHKALMVKGLFIYNFADVGTHFVLIGHIAVSYTHLDVYKRQALNSALV